MKKLLLWGVGGFILLIIIISVASSGGSKSSDDTTTTTSDDTSASVTASAKASPSKPKSTAPALTSGQSNAVRAAKNYLQLSGFSRTGLIGQLKQGDGYSQSDAAFAVDSLKLNYVTQATRAGKAYLKISGFSHSGLVSQLQQGDGYTADQAEKGATAAGA